MCEKKETDAFGNELKYGDWVEVISSETGLPVGMRLRYIAPASEFGLHCKPGQRPILGPLVDSTTRFLPSSAIRKVTK